MKNWSKKKTIISAAIALGVCFLGIGAFILAMVIQNRGNSTVDGDEVFKSEWDISWYDETKEEYTITTKEQLYGLADLSQITDFKDKTVKLGKDIMVNEGNAAEWQEKKPKLAWNPINKFAGTFDGQGHTISGLYRAGGSGGTGMFADTQRGCVIKDFKLVNTYFAGSSSKGTGSISSGGGGTFSKIYSDAILNCSGFFCGGIIGMMNKEVSVEECWYDGDITIAGQNGGGITGSLTSKTGKIKHCLNTANITSTYKATKEAFVGGLCGSSIGTLIIEDSLNVGKVVSTEGLSQIGALIGIISGGDTKITNTWVTRESNGYVVPKGTNFISGGGWRRTYTDRLKGVGGYQQTDLDFENYWAVVEDDIPIPKCFAKEVPDVSGLERTCTADVSWFNGSLDEYTLTTPEQLVGMAVLAQRDVRFTDKVVKLGNDIVLNTGNAAEYGENAPVNYWEPIKYFNGVFDGQGYSISGLYMYATGSHTVQDCVALFRETSEKAIVRNLQIKNSYLESTFIIGQSAVSARGGGTFQNIRVHDDVYLRNDMNGNIGGIMGMVTRTYTLIENCWSAANIEAYGGNVGGILGDGNGWHAIIKHCLHTGKIHRNMKNFSLDLYDYAQYPKYYYDKSNEQCSFGGIAGKTGNNLGKGVFKGSFLIEDCLHTGTITSDRKEDQLAGAVGYTSGPTETGEPSAKVVNCYSTVSSCTKTIVINRSSKFDSDCIRLKEEKLLGAAALSYTGLDFKNYWVAIEGKTPILKSFKTSSDKAVNSKATKIYDVSWYSSDKKTFTITTAKQLYGVERLSQCGINFKDVTIKLGADIVVNKGSAAEWAKGSAKPALIWEPIRTFAGTLDGQGHTISGLYGFATGKHADATAMGLVRITTVDAVVKNLNIANSYFGSTYRNGVAAIVGTGGGTFQKIHVGKDVYLKNPMSGGVGGIMGVASMETTLVENCWSEANITAYGMYVGGIVGNGDKRIVTIKHCLHSGTITRDVTTRDISLYDYAEYKNVYGDMSTTSGYYGGILGGAWAMATDKKTYIGTYVVDDCLNIGTLTSNYSKDVLGGVIGRTGGLGANGKDTITVTNSYCIADSALEGAIGRDVRSVQKGCLALEEKDLLGEKSYINTYLDFVDTKNADGYWVARVNATPMLTAFKTSGDALVKTAGLSKRDGWFNVTTNSGTITTAEHLYSFAMNILGWDFNENTKVTLGADIDLNPGWNANAENFTVPENIWTPIIGFSGIFDGNGHTIRGLCITNTTGISGIGLFTQVDGATIQNLNVENSYMTGSTGLGCGLIGQGSGTFKNIKSDITMNITGEGVGNVGGILGLATGKVSLDTCMSSSTITSNRKRVGGIVGNCNGNTVTIAHCLNAGNLTFTNPEDIGMMGGILGLACLLNAETNDFSGLGAIRIEDCMSTGTVSSYGVRDNAKSTTVGGIIGVLDNGSGKETVKAPVTITSTYYVQHENENADIKMPNTIVGLRSKLNATNIGVGSVSDMTGILSYYNARHLDWYHTGNTNGHWVVQGSGTPMLKQFADAQQVFDISGLNQNEFVLVDNVGYIPNSSILKSFVRQMNAGTLVTNSETQVKVLDDIDMNPGWVATNKKAPDENGYVWKQIKGFAGTFDGGNHTIRGLYVTNAEGVSGIGMFTEVSGATIQNLRVANSYFTGNTSLGTGIIGQGSGTFTNIYADVVIGLSGGTTAAGNVGGILGLATGNTTISDCWSNCAITSTRKRIGGIVGYCGGYEVTISHCFNTGNLSYIGDDKGYIGGILGLACLANSGSFEGVGSVTVEDCLTTGCVISNKTTDNTIGGVIGCVGNGSGTGTGVAPVTLSTSYFLQHTISNTSVVTATKLSGAYSGISPVNCGKATTLASLQGDSAKTTAKNLDWYDATSNADGYWITREEEIPILKIMEDVTE